MEKLTVVNYFEWFDIPEALQIDQADLKRKFYLKSKDLHPDFHTYADSQTQLEILQKASINNRAYKTLHDFDATLKYVLELHEQLGEEGQLDIPQEFLMEMMDLNEAVMDLQMAYHAENYHQLAAQIASEQSQLDQSVSHLIQAKDTSKFSDGDWSLLRDYYLKRRYLLRLEENFKKTEKPN